MSIPAAIQPNVPITRIEPKLFAESSICENATAFTNASVGM